MVRFLILAYTASLRGTENRPNSSAGMSPMRSHLPGRSVNLAGDVGDMGVASRPTATIDHPSVPCVRMGDPFKNGGEFWWLFWR